MTRGFGAMERLRADLVRRARNDRATEAVEQHIGVAPLDRPEDSAEASPATSSSSSTSPSAEAEAEAQPSTPRQRAFLDRLPAFPRRVPEPHTSHHGPKLPPGQPPRPCTLASSRYSESGNPPSSLPSPIPMAPLEPQPLVSPEPAAYPASPARPRESLARLGYGDNPPQPSTTVPVTVSPDHHPQPPSQTTTKPHPKKFMFCFPWVKSRRVRSQILTCFVSGMFLATLLAVYLGLALTNHISRGEVTIMIILIILSATMFFCYSVVRLCVIVSRGDRTRRRRLPEMVGPGGYLVPPKPIPVVLVRDEEAAGIESEAATSRPPAYGLWRESVRADPNRLFWQRNEAAEPVPRRPESAAGPRPPSYASDDGISYVVEARPRSVAPPAPTYTVPASEVPPVPRV